MTIGEEDSGAPIAGTVTPEERKNVDADAEGNRQAASVLATEKLVPADEGLVTFVAAAEYANLTKLVKNGEPKRIPQEGLNRPGEQLREGDIWVKFVEGVLNTDVPEVIAWANAHPKICRRTSDPMTKGWATIKEAQARRSWREPLMTSSDMDADEAFPVGGVGNLQGEAAKSGSAGADLVESAELTRKALEQRAEENPSEA